jgi:hypothetical protein
VTKHPMAINFAAVNYRDFYDTVLTATDYRIPRYGTFREKD